MSLFNYKKVSNVLLFIIMSYFRICTSLYTIKINYYRSMESRYCPGRICLTHFKLNNDGIYVEYNVNTPNHFLNFPDNCWRQKCLVYERDQQRMARLVERFRMPTVTLMTTLDNCGLRKIISENLHIKP